jgi:hypothetical protein
MQTNRNGDCAPFAPDKMATAATTAKPMKKKPTLVGKGFPVTFMARSILSLSSQIDAIRWDEKVDPRSRMALS